MADRIIRGLQDVRTLSGSIDDRSVPFRAYMKLSVLEMEKFRRGKERESALTKVKEIDERFRVIEAEKQEILASMATQRGGGRRPGDPEQQPAPERVTARAFKIKY